MRFFRNRLRARITLESLVGVNAPLLVAGGYMAVRPEGADWTLLSVLGVASIASAVATAVRMRREVEPVAGIAASLRDFVRHDVWRPAAHRPYDEIGQLARAAESVVENAQALRRDRDDNARRDVLTGLPNRCAFMETIGKREPASLALIEIDRLKSVNDLYGQAEGDELLRGFAAFAVSKIGPRDILARWSGAEFVLYLDEDDPDRAREALETLREAVASAAGISQHRVTFSAGLVAMSGNIDLDSAAAEELLHAAKNTGRNSVMTPMLAIDGGAGELRELSESFDMDVLLSGT
ncbi:MAG: hypothetical protein CL534_01855 [Ahrensia sp.]|nr:hypothetical protein [Ahrensia sp.]